MKTKLLIIVFVILVTVTTYDAYADNTVFSKDIGEGLSQDECQKRYDLFGTHYEPIMDLAKLKIETHSAFKEVTNNDSYQIISTGLRSSPYSENCKMDLPSFGIHYATNMTDFSYTRIYVNLERISYDVHEITTRLIDRPWIDVPKSEPLPFYITNWDVVHMLGEYHRSDPPKSPQTFKIPYIAVNGKVNSIDTQSGSIVAEISTNEGGMFALKIPRNYPYTDHDDSMHSGHGLEVFAISDGPEEVNPHVTKTDCFYDVWMQVSGNQTIEIPFTFSYLMNDPMHGDSDVPEYCLTKTLADENLNYLATLSPHKQAKQGVLPYLVSCKDGWYLVIKHDDSPACVSYNTAQALWDRGWVDKSTDIYTKYAIPEVLDEFSSKLKSRDEALQIVGDFIDETNLELNTDPINTDFKITSSLGYVKSQGTHLTLEIDEKSGLPTEIMTFGNEGFYRTPQWYSEIQKDYLGLPSQRIEHGHVAWEVDYRECNLCQTYSSFFVDAITGKVFNTRNVEDMFTIL
ncbi:hypothetical protein [Candidatus Nitrosopumilus salaria]|nr:hypothetical protein [Candidatus Nitrosopumilus salaria]